jgi:N-acetylmuramoyl-L-alanine amidase
MRRSIALTVALLGFGPSAATAPRDVVLQATPTDGAAPLSVAFSATGDATSAHWDFGDGASADGASVQHTYQAGRWTATLTARTGSGETVTKTATITARGITLAGPKRVRYGGRGGFHGAVVPPEQGVAVTVDGGRGLQRTTKTRADGTFAVKLRLVRPASVIARRDTVASAPVAVALVPQLRTQLVGAGTKGGRFFFSASVRPKGAGELAITIARSGRTILDRTFRAPVRFKLDTQRLVAYRIHVTVRPNAGFTAVGRLVRATVVLPRLAYGTRGSAVVQLGQRLRALHYAAPYSAVFDSRLLDAVYAFQKVQGLARTGTVDVAFWRRLAAPRMPAPRYAQPASHVEIDKPHQVLYLVRGGQIALIVPVSTAGLPGKFTPVGRFSIYRKVVGFDPSPLGTLYDPMYFTGGYAIHGNPSVPPYPASHGCVRVPMWLAGQLFATNPYGETVYVY